MTSDEKRQRRLAEMAQAREELSAHRKPEPEAIDEIEVDDELDDPVEPQVAVMPEPEDVLLLGDDEPIRDLTPFDRFVLNLDDGIRELLDEAELKEIYEAQQTKARDEKRAEAKKAAMARARTAARIDEGLVPPETADDIALRERMDEMVDFTVDLPETGDIGLRIDQKIFLHGVKYKVTRAQYDSMRATIYLAQQAELLFEGKDKRNWLRRRARGGVLGSMELAA